MVVVLYWQYRDLLPDVQSVVDAEDVSVVVDGERWTIAARTCRLVAESMLTTEPSMADALRSKECNGNRFCHGVMLEKELLTVRDGSNSVVGRAGLSSRWIDYNCCRESDRVKAAMNIT